MIKDVARFIMMQLFYRRLDWIVTYNDMVDAPISIDMMVGYEDELESIEKDIAVLEEYIQSYLEV